MILGKGWMALGVCTVVITWQMQEPRLCHLACSIKNYVDAALRLADMQAAGKIAHLGVTNFDVTRLQQLLDADVPIVSNQVPLAKLLHSFHWIAPLIGAR